jgi:hypothetical protein
MDGDTKASESLSSSVDCSCGTSSSFELQVGAVDSTKMRARDILIGQGIILGYSKLISQHPIKFFHSLLTILLPYYYFFNIAQRFKISKNTL